MAQLVQLVQLEQQMIAGHNWSAVVFLAQTPEHKKPSHVYKT